MEGCEDVEEDGGEMVEGIEAEKEDKSSAAADKPSEEVAEKIAEEKERSDLGNLIMSSLILPSFKFDSAYFFYIMSR